MIKKLTRENAGKYFAFLMCCFFLFATTVVAGEVGGNKPLTPIGLLGVMFFFNVLAMFVYVFLRYVWGWNDSSPWLISLGALALCLLFGYLPYALGVSKIVNLIFGFTFPIPFVVLYNYGCRKIKGMGYNFP